MTAFITVRTPTVLICGAGIAGPALAFWLSRNGYRLIVLDIAINSGVMTWMHRRPMRPLAARLWFSTADSIPLPDY